MQTIPRIMLLPMSARYRPDLVLAEIGPMLLYLAPDGPKDRIKFQIEPTRPIVFNGSPRNLRLETLDLTIESYRRETTLCPSERRALARRGLRRRLAVRVPRVIREGVDVFAPAETVKPMIERAVTFWQEHLAHAVAHAKSR